jgi:hypothetical protein
VKRIKLNWTKARCKELDKLRQLLQEGQAINRGSHVVERLRRITRLATALDRSNINTGRPSFHQFLTGLAIAERHHKPKGE